MTIISVCPSQKSYESFALSINFLQHKFNFKKKKEDAKRNLNTLDKKLIDEGRIKYKKKKKIK